MVALHVDRATRRRLLRRARKTRDADWSCPDFVESQHLRGHRARAGRAFPLLHP